jgi:hypothetical protein
MEKIHHGAKSPILASVLYQSSWKFYTYLHLGFTALLPHHHHHAITVQILHSLVGRNILKCFMMWSSAVWILLLVFHHSSPTISIAKTVYQMYVGIFFIYKCLRHSEYNHMETQHSHTSLDSV